MRVALIVVVIVGVIGAAGLHQRPASAAHRTPETSTRAIQHSDIEIPNGPTIAVGTASFDRATRQLVVPIATTGSIVNAYSGFNIHLRWDPKVFSFSDANAAGGLFDPNAHSATSCSLPQADDDGGGVVFGCGGIGFCVIGGGCFVSPIITNAGLLATVVLTARHSGCSALHLVTHAPLGNGGENRGTLTWSAVLPITPELNAYVDGVGVARTHGRVAPAECLSHLRPIGDQ